MVEAGRGFSLKPISQADEPRELAHGSSGLHSTELLSPPLERLVHDLGLDLFLGGDDLASTVGLGVHSSDPMYPRPLSASMVSRSSA